MGKLQFSLLSFSLTEILQLSFQGMVYTILSYAMCNDYREQNDICRENIYCFELTHHVYFALYKHSSAEYEQQLQEIKIQLNKDLSQAR